MNQPTTSPFSFLKQYSVSFFILNAIVILLSILIYFYLPPQIPLWHSLALPEQKLTNKEFIAVLPLSILIVTLLHTGILTLYTHIDPQTKKIVWSGTLLVLLIFCIAFIKVIVASL